jgi:methyl-accepting chemotaxis protein
MTETTEEMTTPPKIPPFYRRTYLIDRKGQLTTTFKVAGLVAFLLLVLNLVLAGISAGETRKIISVNPNLAQHMAATDRSGSLVIAGGSVFLLLLVVAHTIVLTHRTSGASFNIKRCLGRVAEGDLDTTLRLRTKDNLLELQEPFNRMAESLRKRASEEQKLLNDLSSKIEEFGHPEEAKILRDIADSKRSSTG